MKYYYQKQNNFYITIKILYKFCLTNKNFKKSLLYRNIYLYIYFFLFQDIICNNKNVKRKINRSEACDLGSTDELFSCENFSSSGKKSNYNLKEYDYSSTESLLSSLSSDNNNPNEVLKTKQCSSYRMTSIYQDNTQLVDRISDTRKNFGSPAKLQNEPDRKALKPNRNPLENYHFKRSYLTHEETLKIIDSIWPLNHQTQSLPCTPKSRLEYSKSPNNINISSSPVSSKPDRTKNVTDKEYRDLQLTNTNRPTYRYSSDDPLIKKSKTCNIANKGLVKKTNKSFDSSVSYKSESSIFRSPLKARILDPENNLDSSNVKSVYDKKEFEKKKSSNNDFIEEVFHSWDNPQASFKKGKV